MKELTYEQYLDKVMGCWIGKTLGGSAGVPFEGIKKRINHDGFRNTINTSVANDDFDLQIMWLQALEERGPYLTAEYMADLWKKACKYPWSEYGYFIKNYNMGIKAPYSGWFNNEFFKNGMGCPIRSEIWAVAYPGLPELAGRAAMTDASLDHADNSMWGEFFLAQLESMLFVEDDFIKAFETCMNRLDKQTRLYACLNDIAEQYKNGASFDESLSFIYKHYSHPDFTNSIQNIAIALLGVMHGDMDMEKTIDITLQGGYDADCTCATAGSIVGIAIGAAAIPEDIKALIDDSYVSAVDIQRKDNRISTFAQDSARVGVSMIRWLRPDDMVITGMDSDFPFIEWERPEKALKVAVEYEGMPAIGANDVCRLRVLVSNEGPARCAGRLEIRGLKEGWQAFYEDKVYDIPKDSRLEISARVETGALKYIDQTNLLEAVFTLQKGGEAKARFGIAGAVPYRLYGPFFNMADWEIDSTWPPCHGGADLPSIVSMVHNEVLLDREYLDEARILEDPACYTENLIGTIYAKEDVIPVESSVSIIGECGFILVCDVLFERDMKAWVVVGNTDAFRIHLNGEQCIKKDEHFYWTPINNAFIGDFKKGHNRLVIKLLRRSDSMKFSLGIKEHNNKHYHQTFWLDNLRYQIIG